MIRPLARRLPYRQLGCRRCLPSTTLSSPRTFTSGYPRMAPHSSPLSPVDPPISATLPSDAFQLLSTDDKVGATEDALFEQQVRDVEEWWKTPRFEGIKRPYSARDVVSKRGTLQQSYPSSLMARKLFNLLNERAAEGKPVHTSKEKFMTCRTLGN